MLARLVTLLAILAITVAVTAASAHGARLSASGPHHAAHGGEMMHAPDLARLACDGDRHCGSANAGMCEVVCAGFAAVLTSPNAQAGQECMPFRHAFPPEPSHIGRAPGLTERPPKLCLL